MKWELNVGKSFEPKKIQLDTAPDGVYRWPERDYSKDSKKLTECFILKIKDIYIYLGQDGHTVTKPDWDISGSHVWTTDLDVRFILERI